MRTRYKLAAGWMGFAIYVHGLAKNHGYVEGNKRTASHVLMTFLGANGFPVILADEWVGIVEGVADSFHQLTDIIVARLLGGVNVPLEPPPISRWRTKANSYETLLGFLATFLQKIKRTKNVLYHWDAIPQAPAT